VKHKVIVLTGAMQPARFRSSDAIFNLRCAVGALQVLTPVVCIAMGMIVQPAHMVAKNRAVGCFEAIVLVG
jgi:L-asparaginase